MQKIYQTFNVNVTIEGVPPEKDFNKLMECLYDTLPGLSVCYNVKILICESSVTDRYPENSELHWSNIGKWQMIYFFTSPDELKNYKKANAIKAEEDSIPYY